MAGILRVDEPIKALILYDKVKEIREVLMLMIKMLVERKRPTYFCSTIINGIPEEY